VRYQIIHKTSYSGSEPISVGHNEAWLTPRETETQTCLAHELRVEPTPSILSKRVDYFGNTVTQFSFNQGYQTLVVTAENEIELREIPREARTNVPWESVTADVLCFGTPADRAAYEFVFDSTRCRQRPEFAAYARTSFPAGRPVIAATTDLMLRINREFAYDPLATNVSTSVEQVFRQQRGVCQDFAHLMISMLRSLGIAARYVSGYLRTFPAAGRNQLVGSAASHAWLAAYCGPAGWVDFDPTNKQIPTTDHLTVAWGRDYSDVAPLKGVYIGGGSLRLEVEVQVTPVTEEGEGVEDVRG